MMCDNDVASLLLEEVAEIDCSTFLMEEIEIEMQQEQFSKFNIDSSSAVCMPTSVQSPLKSNYNQLVPTGLTCITTGKTEIAVPTSTITATGSLNHSISSLIDRESEDTLLTAASQTSPSQVSVNSLEVFTTFLEDVEEVVECSSGEPIGCEEKEIACSTANRSCSKLKRRNNQSTVKQEAEQEPNLDKQLLAPPPPSINSSLVCKWTDCDWPGSYEDLVDHIRELHVELQPFESTQLQLFLSSHKNTTNGSRSNNNNHNNRSTMGTSSSRQVSTSTSTYTSSSSSCSSSPPSISTANSSPHRASETAVSFQSPAVNGKATSNCLSSSSSSSNAAVATNGTSSRCKSSRTSLSNDLSSRVIHDEPEKSYVCLWEGCKVYGVRSQKRSWLDRHVLQHSGDKPFKCIVENCGERFKSQSALEKHVNQHFKSSNSNGNIVKDSISNCSVSNSDGSSEHGSDDSTRRTTMMRAKSAKGMCCKETQSKQPNAANGSSHSVAGTPCKLNSTGKKRKVPRLRRVLVRGCSEDFFDSSVMDIIQFRLFKLNHLTGSDSIDRIALHSKVIAKRVDDLGQTHLLLRWYPENVVPDEWIQQSELDANRFKSAPLSLLPSSLEFISSKGSSNSRTGEPVTQHSSNKRKRK